MIVSILLQKTTRPKLRTEFVAFEKLIECNSVHEVLYVIIQTGKKPDIENLKSVDVLFIV